MPEEVAIRNAKGECIGGSVREPLYADPRRVDGEAIKDAREGAVEELDVRPVPPERVVPRRSLGLDSQDYRAGPVGLRDEPPDGGRSVAAGPVEGRHQSGGLPPSVARGHEEVALAPLGLPEGLEPHNHPIALLQG